MKTYKKGLIILSAIFILPTFANADEPTGLNDLEVTIAVVESPEDSSQTITDRIEVPTKEYLKARERNRLQYRYRKTDSGEYQAEGAQEMYQNQIQNREMIQEHQEQMQSQIRDEATGSSGGNLYGKGNR